MKARLFALAFLTAACISTKPGAEAVRITNNPLVVRDCEFKGNVTAFAVLIRNREVRLRNKAVRLGGNVVYLVSAQGGYRTAEVYRCSQP